jgi:hypothetical protein
VGEWFGFSAAELLTMPLADLRFWNNAAAALAERRRAQA